MRRNTKSTRPQKRPASIDGIINDNRALGEPLKRGSTSSKTDSNLGQISRRGDGFHPSRQSTTGIGQPISKKEELKAAETLEDDEDAPILLKPKKGRRLAFWRREKRPWTKKRILKWTAASAAVLIILFAGLIGWKFYATKSKVLAGGGHAPAVCSDEVPLSQLNAEGDGRVNILMLGIGGPGHDGPNLSDTIIVASLDPINNRVKLLSIPRDLWVSIPNSGNNKINAAFAFGKENSLAKGNKAKTRDGLKLIDETLKPILGIPIHYHAVVNFTAFKDIVDAIGGVTVNVPETLVDPSVAWENNYNATIAKKGFQKFNGNLALLYAKSRHTSPRGDFDRAERQRLMLVAIKDKALTLSTLSNPVKIISLLNGLNNNVYTDFDTGSLKCLRQQITEVPSDQIKSVDLVTPPHDLLTTTSIDGLSAVTPIDGLFNYTAIQKYVHKILPDGLIVHENAPVAVYNATTQPGLATTRANELKTLGYNVQTVANAPKSAQGTDSLLVDLSGGQDQYTRSYLEKRFKLTAQNELPSKLGITPPEGTRFVIILGANKPVANPAQQINL